MINFSFILLWNYNTKHAGEIIAWIIQNLMCNSYYLMILVEGLFYFIYLFKYIVDLK